MIPVTLMAEPQEKLAMPLVRLHLKIDDFVHLFFRGHGNHLEDN